MSMPSNLSTDQLLTSEPGQNQTCSGGRSDVTEIADSFADAPHASTPPAGTGTDAVGHGLANEVRLTLEEARLVTGATGAAIALIRGAKMVCVATSGPDAPDLGADIDPDSGLTGSCIQTRQLQQCSDTDTDPRVDVEACRFLEIRSVVVLPLLDSGNLFGVLEIFSSKQNAFGQSDGLTLQALADRVCVIRSQGWKGPPILPSEESALDPVKPALLAQFPRASVKQDSINSRSGYRNASLIAVLVALSVLLGWMMGRAGWDKAVNLAQHEIPTSSQQVGDFSVRLARWFRKKQTIRQTQVHLSIPSNSTFRVLW